MRQGTQLFITLVLSTAAVACGDDEAGPADAPAGSPDAVDQCALGCDGRLPDADTVDANPMPMTLAETGLCLDAGCTSYSPDAVEFTPQFALWTDGAVKRRWIHIPAGAQIDTTDWDSWKFPVGTKVWKDFVRDGIRAETRYYSKIGPGDDEWYFVGFVWNAAQNEAVAAPAGMQDVNGTQHDVPSRSQCRQCHDQMPGRVLGFSALQLDTTAMGGQVDLSGAITRGWLSLVPATLPTTTPRMPLPGSSTEQAALGYLHANCGHCHNPRSSVHGAVPLELRLESGAMATTAMTAAYVTAVDVAASIPVMGRTVIVDGGSPSTSTLHFRFTMAGPAQRMPKIGTEIVDPAGTQILTDWINALP